MSTRILCGDCRAVMATLEQDSVDAIVTDPPYGLSFMGKEWDHGVPGVEFWTAALRVAKPGAHMLAFGGTRTYHRLICAIEDAGWEIRDCIGWMFGTGFPKSLNLGDGRGTALKPAYEPIIMARKPIVGTIAANVLEHGTGAINVDACRVPSPDGVPLFRTRPGDSVGTFVDGGRNRTGEVDTTLGRWPANLIHDSSPEVVALFPESAGQQAGNVGCTHKNGAVTMNGFNRAGEMRPRNDTGSAARFFYCAKASRADREEGLEAFMPKQRDDSREVGAPGGDNPRNRGTQPRRNNHPTVKPTELMRYLCRLVTPKGGVVLDPFCGSGSTGKAAVLERFAFVGIEQDPDFCDIARARIAWAESHATSEQLSFLGGAV